YGSTRENLLSVEAVLSDGTTVEFKDLSVNEFNNKINSENPLEASLYKQINDMLSSEEVRNNIDEHFPKKSIPRRNTGYAIDLLKNSAPFGGSERPFNFCQIIAGSEGTLAFITKARLKVEPLPPPVSGLICVHCKSIHESLLVNLEALKFTPSACELIDHFILECTKDNKNQMENRFFIEGDPQALLVVELHRNSEEELQSDVKKLTEILIDKNLGYHYPLVTGSDTKRVWDLRKAGLGLLSNMPGDAKPVPVIEDTAVDVQDLPEYITEFNEKLKEYGLFCVHYAHAGSGELHLRPILDLKTQKGNDLFRQVAIDIAHLVKKYKGSLSGEHGDGRLRGEFIPFMIGDKNFQLIQSIKKTWDPNGIFNPGKIVDTPPMNTSLRFTPGQKTAEYDTLLDFSKTKGILRAIEQCNGSGDCRKTEKSGGTMCPSYMATRDERDTTRARANILREALTHPENTGGFASDEGKEILDLCLSCKGCKSECPSNVDMAKIKAEYMFQYYRQKGISLRNRIMGHFSMLYRLGSRFSTLSNLIVKSTILSGVIKKITGIAPKRSLPGFSKITVSKWYKKEYPNIAINSEKQLYFYADEFTDLTDAEIGITAIKLLNKLGYEVKLLGNEESGRTFISKGFLDKAKVCAEKNVAKYKDLISENIPLVGLEPSAILTFRDEILDLVPDEMKPEAKKLSAHCLTFEEFITKEWQKQRISRESFTKEPAEIILHGHCHQKAISSVSHGKNILSIPENYTVKVLPTGCCGMAGSFGYEKEHFELSNKVGELVLFPEVRKATENTIIAAAGTSCRHQIADGTGKKSLHPAVILWNALV
ncbi:MAG: 4Fe-4S dicluster domain-containing protein, partial [Cyclobacteriaceae bacterium]|nr:4Fe-4S dicluster domain-containing protein [Cyclobacteriaceae bacterium]